MSRFKYTRHGSGDTNVRTEEFNILLIGPSVSDGAFGSHLLVALLSFSVLLGIVALIHSRTATG
jgi:hypothetical protein